MKKEAYEYESDGFVSYENASEDINDDGVICMQRMVIYSAAVGIEEGLGKNMIHIYQHSCEQDEIIPLPVFFIIPVRDEADKDEMEEVMGEGLEHFIPVISDQ